MHGNVLLKPRTKRKGQNGDAPINIFDRLSAHIPAPCKRLTIGNSILVVPGQVPTGTPDYKRFSVTEKKKSIRHL